MEPACPTCGSRAAAAFSAGGVCVRCAGIRVLEQEAGESAAAAMAVPPHPAAAPGGPERIGGYELIEELGRGGMGRVFVARQPGLGRIVALKVIAERAAGQPGSELRFLREARTVARLRHPNIVAIYDLAEADGSVYFSMEYLEDGDLARRLRDRPLAPREAAALVRKVAAALAYAHGEGILHRDIKPSNILLDGDEPRLADFGLAAELQPGGRLTEATGLLGTPHYLAPEALRGGGTALSVASDIYALGVVLFELLTGRTPFAGASPAELPRLLDQADPPNPRLLAPVVPRDLEIVCLKCLEREPARRYATAAALADDLGRFLNGEPVAARRPGAWLAVAKFARRHQAGVAAGAATAATLIVATVVSVVLAVRATRAERRAASEARASQEISNFLRNDVLAQAAPDAQPDRDLKLRTVLDGASRRIDGQFPDDPLVEADLRETLADTYGSLGLYASSQPHIERALALRRQMLGPLDPGVIRLMGALADDLAEQGKLAQAEPLELQTIALERQVAGPGDPLTLNAMNDLTFIYKAEGKLGAAESNAAQALATARKALGPDDYQSRAALSNLASIYWSEEKYAEAEKLNVEAVEIDTRVEGPDTPTTLVALSNLASVYWSEGKLAQSEAANLHLLQVRERVLGPDHPNTLRSMHNLATTYFEEGKFAEAERWEKQDYAARLRLLGPNHEDTLSAMNALAVDELELGRPDAAWSLDNRAYATARRLIGPDHFLTLNILGSLARIAERTGRLSQAEAMYRELWQRSSGPPGGPASRSAVTAATGLGAVLVEEKRFAEAESILRPAWAALKQAKPADWHTYAAESELGAAVAGLGRFPEAEALEVSAFRGLVSVSDRISARNRPVLGQAGERVVRLYEALGRTAEARKWSQQAAAAAAK